MKLKQVVQHTLTVSSILGLLAGGAAWSGTAYAATSDQDAVTIVQSLVGEEYTPYEETPVKGFDASGLVHYVFGLLDYELPRTLTAQYKMDRPLVKKLADIQPGDMLFFGNQGRVQFNGVYIGSNKFVMASKSRDEVVTRTLSTGYRNEFIGAQRVLNQAGQKRVKIVMDAREYLGTPYLFGAKYGQTNTFDCSSFVKTVFASNGYTLPRVSRDQALQGTPIKRSELQVGDLVFFTTKDSKVKIGHVGIYVGDGMMIHTYGEGGVKYSTIERGWWNDHYVTARRLIKG